MVSLLDITETEATLLDGDDLVSAPSVQDLFADLSEGQRAVALLLPASLVRARQIEVDVPLSAGAPLLITHTHVNAALETLRHAAEGPGTACLYCAPLGFALDGRRGHFDPVGQRASALTVNAVTLSVSLKALMPLERQIKAAGGTLVDSVTPHLAVTALIPSAQDGAAVHIGHNATVVSVLAHGQLVATGTARIGARHFIGDVMKAFDLTATQARPLVDQFFDPDSSGPLDELTEKVIRARLEEWAEHCAAILVSALMVSDITLSGMYADQPVLRDRFRKTLMATKNGSQPRIIEGAASRRPLLHGAAAVLKGEGPIAPQGATFTLAPSQSRGRQVIDWIQAHF